MRANATSRHAADGGANVAHEHELHNAHERGAPPVHRDHYEHECEHELHEFDARSAKCFLETDSARLHKVIETTGYEKIHELVSNII